jgi:DNA-binding beta-propeller fold protein YncE
VQAARWFVLRRRAAAAAVAFCALTLAVLAVPVRASVPTAAMPNPSYPHLLYAPNFSSNVATVFDLQTYKVVKYIDTQAAGPCCAHVTPDGKKVMIVGGFSPYVVTTDVATLSVIRKTRIGHAIGDIGSDIQSDGKMFWASDLPLGNVYGIDIATGAVKTTFKRIGPHFFVARDGKTLYAAHNNEIVAWSTTTKQVLGTVPTNGGTGPSMMMLRDNKHLYVQGTDIDVIDVSDPRHMKNLMTIPVGVTGWVGQLTPDGSQYWIPGTDDGKVTIVDTRKNAVIKKIDVGAYGGGIDISRDGRAYVAVSDRPLGPVKNTALAFSYLGVVPGAALGVPSTTYRPGIDPPGEIYVYDTRTYKRIATPPMKMPSISFVLDVVENPPATATRATPERPTTIQRRSATPSRSLASTGLGPLPLIGTLLLAAAAVVCFRRGRGANDTTVM